METENPNSHAVASDASPTKKAKPLAIASVIVGVLSLLLFPKLGMLGLIAIVLGVVAGRQLGAAGEKRPGRKSARAGMITGGIALVFWLLLVALVKYQEGATLKVTKLDEAETAIFEQAGGETGFGNNEDAVALARAAAAEMARFCEESIGEKPFGISIMGDNHVAFCHRGKNSLAFLVFVPNLRKYSAEAKEKMLNHAWTAAGGAARQIGLKEGAEMAIALRGGLTYDGIIIGELGSEPTRTDESGLRKYFK